MTNKPNQMTDDTDYLNNSPHNRELLEAAIQEAKQGQGVQLTLEEWEKLSDQAPNKPIAERNL